MKNPSKVPGEITIRPLRIILGGLILFLAANMVFALINPSIASLNLVNKVLPGFERFPAPRITLEKNGITDVTGEFVANLDVLFSSHIISVQEKPKDEYRIILVGDSTVWGSRLTADQTLTTQMNQAKLKSCDGRRIVVYNLGYPGVSAIKDLMILSQAVNHYQPDMVIWSFTLSTLVPERIRDIGFSVANHDRLLEIERKTGYPFGADKNVPAPLSFLDRTIYGRRQELNYLLRLAMFDLKSQSIGTDYLKVQEEGELGQGFSGQDDRFFEFTPRDDLANLLDFNFLRAGIKIAGDIPVIFINEPILIDETNPVRYNQVYPRWAFDQYRDSLTRLSTENAWTYIDMWDLLPKEEFTDTDFHRTFTGETKVMQELVPVIQAESCKK